MIIKINLTNKVFYSLVFVFVLVALVIGVRAYTGVDKTKPYHDASQIEMANGESLQEAVDNISSSITIINDSENSSSLEIANLKSPGHLNCYNVPKYTPATSAGGYTWCNPGDYVAGLYYIQMNGWGTNDYIVCCKLY